MSEEMGIVERIARGLKAACIYKGMMGCRKLSKLSGVEFHTTRRYLLGEQTRLRIEEIERLCKVLDTNADDIWRWKQKNGAEDLRKAIWYINKLIEEKED